MRTFAFSFCSAALILFTATAEAQIYKCLDKAGGTTYSSVPCGGVQSSKTLDIPTSGYPDPSPRVSSTSSNPFDRELRGRIAAALSSGDFLHARSLAVTEEHFAMIRQAQREKDAADLERRRVRAANRPTICTNHGFQLGAHYSGQTICR